MTDQELEAFNNDLKMRYNELSDYPRHPIPVYIRGEGKNEIVVNPEWEQAKYAIQMVRIK